MLKSFLSKLHLNFPDPHIEQEFRHIRSQSVSENVRVTFFFLAFFLFTVGIPAIIDKKYTVFASSFIAVAVIALIYCSEIFLRNKFGQIMVAMVVLAFNVCRFLFVPNDFNHVPKTLTFIRGYAFASLNLMLISQFPEIKQKILAIILSFALRFAVVGQLESEAVQADTILRNILIDLFVIYNFYLLERRERKIFFNFSQYREELLKFKEFMASHLPQSLIIIDQSASKSLFSNQAFKNLFEKMKSHKLEAQQTIDTVQIVLDGGEPPKLDLDTLKVNKESIREVGTLYPSENQSTSSWVFLEDLKEQLIKDPRLDHKALSFSASYQVEGRQNRSFEVVVMKMKWDKENAVAFLLNDITYQENLLALKMAVENKDRIIATVSHELRTPLTGIIGILGMAEAKIEDPKIRGYLDLCRDNANLLLGLVNSLLDLQQMRKGTLKLNISKIDIRKTIRDVTQFFLFQCNRKSIYLRFHVEKDVPLHINTDENRLKQIFINLIGNAIKFTFTGGIDISIINSLNETCGLDISVTDTGIGIKEEDRDNLFKMYVRLRDGETFNKNGVGLGLMISNALAGLLNGGHDHKNIHVTSQFGCGTCFSFAILKDLTDFSPCKSPEKKKKKTFNQENYKQQPSLELEENSSYGEEEQGCSELTGEINLGSKIADYTLLRSVNTNNFESITKLEKVYDKLLHTFEEDPIKISEEKYVLVVEDNPFNLLIAENYLKDAGYQCKTAGNGQEAIEVIKAHKGLASFRVILMDCQMPIMNGFETTRVLREMMKRKEISEIPIVALTANHSDEDIHKCYESGMTACLLKPLQKSLLFETLDRMQSSSC